MLSLQTLQSPIEEDLALLSAILNQFLLIHGKPLPFFVPVFNEEENTIKLMLPGWIDSLLIAMKTKYGESYYPFAVNQVLEELLRHTTAKDITPEEANQFRLAVNGLMRNPNETLH